MSIRIFSAGSRNPNLYGNQKEVTVLWRGFLQRFPSSEFTFAGDFIATVVLEKILKKMFYLLWISDSDIVPSPSFSLLQPQSMNPLV